jgi:hypothetical protein
VGSNLVRLGDFAFKYRGYMLPVAVLLLFIPSPRFTPDPALAGFIFERIGFARLTLLWAPLLLIVSVLLARVQVQSAAIPLEEPQ